MFLMIFFLNSFLRDYSKGIYGLRHKKPIKMMLLVKKNGDTIHPNGL